MLLVVPLPEATFVHFLDSLDMALDEVRAFHGLHDRLLSAVVSRAQVSQRERAGYLPVY